MKKTLSFLTILGLLLLGAAYVVTTYYSDLILSAFHLEPIELVVYAPSSLRNTLDEIKEAYEEENPRVTLNMSFKSSYEIVENILSGHKPDLAIVSSQKDLATLNDKGLIAPDTQEQLDENTLVVIAPADSKIADISDLEGSTVQKIAVGDPGTTPIGHYSETALKNLGLYRELEYKLTNTKNVSTIIEDVINKTTEAGIVFKSDAVNNDKIKIVYEFPQDSYTPVIYTMFEVATEKNENMVQVKALEEYLLSEQSQQVFNRNGFTSISPVTPTE